ncbi:MAG: hypothetical protein DCC55_05295 [Chloroflexi bacterium]|nr:MAG: hypothetical protein DCC55_05295 [Chloroflexota bacterium]
MIRWFQRLVSFLLGTTLMAGLAGCTITVPALPVGPTNTPPPTAGSADSFAGQLMLALVERDYTSLQQMMGDPFAIGYWQSEGVSYPPGIAIADLRSNYLPPGAAPTFDMTTNLTVLLDGSDPLSLWGPEVNAVRAIYVTGLGPERSDEAILIIALDQNDQPYWHSMLVAAGGFVRTEPPTAVPTATPTIPMPNTGVYPTEVRLIRVLQNVNVRSGPGTQFDRIGRYVAGHVVDVFGTNGNVTWWNVRCPNGSVGNCWVTAERDTTQPTTQASPTPTYTPTPLPPPSSPTRIQFPPGGTSATVSGGVQFPNRVQYVLRALAGQEMTVEIFSPGGQANFAIQGVNDGQPYKRLENEARIFTFRLPATQDYLITIATPGGATNYDLRVTVVTPGPPPPVEPTRIRFPPGGTSATVEGLVRPPQQVQYVLRALAGQEMTVQISSPGNLANFAITGASDGQPYKRLVNEERYYSFRLPITQDYLITVASVAGVVDFILTVTVVTPGPPPPGEPIRIQFEPGATSASVSGNLVSDGRQEYLVRALASQEMTVELYADTENTLLAIRGADGTVYKRGEVGGPFFNFTLPATQDYILTVIAAGGDTSYTMVVTIY